MARFVFNLDGVLRQRKRIEQEKQRAMAEKQAVLVELQNALRQMQETVESSNADIRQNRLVGRLDMAFITAHRRFLASMQRQSLSLAQKIALAQRAVEDARAELIEAAKQRKAIEKLREKQFERWRAERARREQAQLDEIGMQLAYHELSEGTERA